MASVSARVPCPRKQNCSRKRPWPVWPRTRGPQRDLWPASSVLGTSTLRRTVGLSPLAKCGGTRRETGGFRKLRRAACAGTVRGRQGLAGGLLPAADVAGHLCCPLCCGVGGPHRGPVPGFGNGGCCLDVSSLLSVHAANGASAEARVRGSSGCWPGGSCTAQHGGGGGHWEEGRGATRFPSTGLCSEGPCPCLGGGICPLSSLGGKTSKQLPRDQLRGSPSLPPSLLVTSVPSEPGARAESPAAAPHADVVHPDSDPVRRGEDWPSPSSPRGTGLHLGTPWLSGLGELLALRDGSQERCSTPTAPGTPPENGPALCPYCRGSPGYRRDLGARLRSRGGGGGGGPRRDPSRWVTGSGRGARGREARGARVGEPGSGVERQYWRGRVRLCVRVHRCAWPQRLSPSTVARQSPVSPVDTASPRHLPAHLRTRASPLPVTCRRCAPARVPLGENREAAVLSLSCAVRAGRCRVLLTQSPVGCGAAHARALGRRSRLVECPPLDRLLRPWPREAEDTPA